MKKYGKIIIEELKAKNGIPIHFFNQKLSGETVL
jgi:hypothetical protein